MTQQSSRPVQPQGIGHAADAGDPARARPALKPVTPVREARHRELRSDEFWRHVPAYRDIDRATFLDHHWQAKNSVTKPERLRAALGDLVSESFHQDVAEGFRRAPMAMRVTPYLISLIDWRDPYADPLRRQFITVGSALLPDHPCLTFDSLAEQRDAPVPGLTHRYPDKALFLPLDTCPVYCRFCTRSYAIGPDSEQVEKVHLRVNNERWEQAFQYIERHLELEDIVVSGGDAFNLRPEQIRQIGERLTSIPHLRRIRYATKGLAVMPMKILTDDAWVSALLDVVELGRSRDVEVVVHTHFNHPREITSITKEAVGRLFARGVIVRNQCVLQRGVNDDADTMTLLVKRLAHVHVQPYYVYMHDMVKGVEDLRTTLGAALELEKLVRGVTAGFHTPAFVVDAPGGGGKRSIHSFEHYDAVTGISVYSAPSVKPGQLFFYYDPIQLLPAEGQALWRAPDARERLTEAARAAAGAARKVLR